MQEVVRLLIGIGVLIIGFPLGYFLALRTKEELKSGRKWFKLLIISSLIGGIIGLIIQNDVIMFSCFFIAIVTNQSLKINKIKRK